jgi:hypothetical protein
MTMPQPTSSIDDAAWANAERGHRTQRWASTTMLAGALQRAAVLGSRADSFSPTLSAGEGWAEKLLQDKNQPEKCLKPRRTLTNQVEQQES